MGLEAYRRKRDFRRTAEPPGKKAKPRPKGLIYAIQKHRARRLHFDLRLEMGGTLKSWAVPKGPSLDGRDKRLAVAVEDHPLEYADFEGEIPKGEYGAGTVELWDRGAWQPEGDPAEALRKGKLKFRLEGEKLKGSWVLVRMGGDGKNWLLMKSPEPFDSAQGKSTVQSPKSAPLPAKLEPQLATLVETPPTGDDWLHEIKFDGYRLLCRIDGKGVRLFTRHGNDWTARFPAIAKEARELPVKQALLDGEVVILDEKGISSFQALQNAMKRGTQQGLTYYVFDLLHLDGQDLIDMPLVRRKELLANAVKGGKVVRYAEHIEGRGAEVYREACARGLEGILSKKRESRYRPGRRSREWVKVKCLDRQEFAIGGFTDPEGARSGFGALLLGTFGPKGDLVYRGRVGTGFSGKALSDLHGRLTKLERASPPFAKAPTGAMARGVHWIEPRLVAEVAFRGWTEDGIVRQAAFEGLREDKPAREIVREKAASEFAGVRLTNPDRVMYPEQGITKSDLAKFYEEISDLILPHIVERPLSLLRCPEGYDKECFYQKHAVEATSRRLRRIMLKDTDERGKEQPHVYIEDAAGLIALVQMGVLEIHPWGSRVGRLENPDRMIFDLDPGPGAPWESVIAGARHIRDRLDDLGLRSFVKTTGGNGLHVVVPLDPANSWDEVKEFARGLAEEMARAAPRYFTAVMSKWRRTGKVYVDYVRNSRGATAVAPFSTRARAGAPVSVPLSWGELDKDLRPDRYTVLNLRERLDRLKTDPWKGFFGVRQTIPLHHQVTKSPRTPV